ncbi:asparagine synthase (glutamine-hydrolyzing) [Bacillus sp. H-16]|uniref:asparagine synthase (glutamine-hydrolyzing) n=1 Tax=Alteribacter salitolerans TaxID=2912333 RepID=UPI001963CA6D|nr:asparagine synthase (glutamine-hydrolyzing) [Alteribacter salitolerans]MBM7096875.1 asparagine synthase (glutamine-hydrolyzing) [Alteribacter salitolerans]
MCGFTAVFSTNQESLNKYPLETITAVITHRGPDDCGYYKSPGVQLGFRRLSIIDLPHGHQPMTYDNGRYTIVFNGEIYNAPELRDRMKKRGATFQTSSDTEVILASFKHEGKKSFTNFRGMFAFLIWDSRTETLTGARDPFGIKPLYMKKDGDAVLFASEKKSLTLFEKKPGINKDVLPAYLTFQYAPEPLTSTSNITKVPPGHIIELKRETGKLTLKPYSQPEFNPTIQEKASAVGKIRRAVEESVEFHLRSDVPVSTFLSGGIDSTAITALVKQMKPDVKAFTAEFADARYSEADTARKTAEVLGLDHHVVTITPEQVVKELPKIIWHMDEPVADPAAIPLYFVAKEAAEHSKVVLSGEGADELFAGYNIYKEPGSLRLFDFLPSGMKKQIHSLALKIPHGVKGRGFLQRGTTPLRERFTGNARIFDPAEVEEYLFETKGASAFDFTAPLYDHAKRKGWDPVTTMQYVDMHTWLRGDILAKADKMTMAHSLELRVPFLDKEVFQVASSLPVSGKVSRKQTKIWLREALADVVPAHVVERKKLGFPVPVRLWLKDELYDWARLILTQSPASDTIFDKGASVRLLEEHVQGKHDHSRKIWTILTYMLWHKQATQSRRTITDASDLKDII